MGFSIVAAFPEPNSGENNTDKNVLIINILTQFILNFY